MKCTVHKWFMVGFERRSRAQRDVRKGLQLTTFRWPHSLRGWHAGELVHLEWLRHGATTRRGRYIASEETGVEHVASLRGGPISQKDATPVRLFSDWIRASSISGGEDAYVFSVCRLDLGRGL